MPLQRHVLGTVVLRCTGVQDSVTQHDVNEQATKHPPGITEKGGEGLLTGRVLARKLLLPPDESSPPCLRCVWAVAHVSFWMESAGMSRLWLCGRRQCGAGPREHTFASICQCAVPRVCRRPSAPRSSRGRPHLYRHIFCP